jgi:hypothetical protein
MTTLASLINDLDPASSDRKPAAKPQFYAVRKCDALRAPAIFFHWDDCRFYVNVKENDDPVEYKSFDMLADAARYLSPQPGKKKEPKKKKAAQGKAGAKTAPASTGTATAIDSLGPNKTSDADEDATNTPTNTAALKDPPPNSLPEETGPPTKRKGLPLQRKAVKKTPPPASAAKASIIKSAKASISAKKTTVKTPPKKKNSSTAKVAKAVQVVVVEKPTMRKSDAKWEEKFQLLKDFKEQYGVVDFLSVRRNNYGKYKGLYTWVRTDSLSLDYPAGSFDLLWFFQVYSLICACLCFACKKAMYYRIRLKQKLKVDETKIQRLTDLGIDMRGGLDEMDDIPVVPKSRTTPNKRETNWEANFRLMNEYKEEFGGSSAFSELKHKSTSPGKYRHLYNWVRIVVCCLFTLLYSHVQYTLLLPHICSHAAPFVCKDATSARVSETVS